MDHSIYDKRKYPIVDVQTGYGEWVQSYEHVVNDQMDLYLIEKLQTVDWSAAKQLLDLACGTGRIGMWLRQRTSSPIDGIDLTPEMMDVARGKNIYRHLQIGDITNTELPDETYDLCTQSLADEHLPNIWPLYREVGRITQKGGTFVIAGFHPQFLMAGMPTHFNSSSGDPLTIRSYVHLLSDHVKAARAAGWSLSEMDEGLVNEEWIQKKPKWRQYFGIPVSFVMVWRRD